MQEPNIKVPFAELNTYRNAVGEVLNKVGRGNGLEINQTGWNLSTNIWSAKIF